MTNNNKEPFIPAWLDDAGLNVFEYRVLSHAWRRGVLYSSLSTIASVTGISKRSVQNTLSALVKKGLVVKEQTSGRKPALYTPVTPGKISAGKKSPGEKQECVASHAIASHAIAQCATDDKITAKSRDKKQGKVEKLSADLPAPRWLNSEIWANFLAHRKEIKARATTRAQELLLSKLAALQAAGNKPEAVLEQSIENGWKGIFPLKNRDRDDGNGKNRKSFSENKYQSGQQWAELVAELREQAAVDCSG